QNISPLLYVENNHHFIQYKVDMSTAGYVLPRLRNISIASSAYDSRHSTWYQSDDTAADTGFNFSGATFDQVSIVSTGASASVELALTAGGPLNSGIYMSGVYNTNYPASWHTMHWFAEQPAGTQMTVYARSCNFSDCSDRSVDHWSEVSNGQDLSGLPFVEDGQQFVQYKIVLVSLDGLNAPGLNSIVINYQLDNKSILRSSIIDSVDSLNEITGIDFIGDIPLDTFLGIQLRTSPDGLVWGPWMGPTGNNDYYMLPGELINTAHRDGIDDRYIQFQIAMRSSSVQSTPMLDSVAISYTRAVPVVDTSVTQQTQPAGSTNAGSNPGSNSNTSMPGGSTSGSVTTGTGSENANASGTSSLVVNTSTTVQNQTQAQGHVHTLPKVELNAVQSGEQRHIIIINEGQVTATARVINVGGATASLSYDWSLTDNSLVDLNSDTNPSTFIFDPAWLQPGLYHLTVTVTDNLSLLSTQNELLIDVRVTSPVLTDADSDLDGLPDNIEGFADSDYDGIPNYLDPAGLGVDQLQITGGILISESGTSLSLGEVAFRAQNNTATVSMADIAKLSTQTSTIGQDMTDSLPHVGSDIDFEIRGLAESGQSIMLVIPLQDSIPENATYRKFLVQTGWQDFVIDGQNGVFSAMKSFGVCPDPGNQSYQPGLAPGHSCIQLMLEDGGPNDADGVADYVIRDPSGLALSASLGNTGTNQTPHSGGGAGFWLSVLMAWFAMGLHARRGTKQLVGLGCKIEVKYNNLLKVNKLNNHCGREYKQNMV
ncbi:MAG: choice-of-anchor U domain-containing protein, partial [Gammaproteobacteria bacterium]